MYNALNEIKLQLHDAPSEVKEAFNTIVGYFDPQDTYGVVVLVTWGNDMEKYDVKYVKASSAQEAKKLVDGTTYNYYTYHAKSAKKVPSDHRQAAYIKKSIFNEVEKKNKQIGW